MTPGANPRRIAKNVAALSGGLFISKGIALLTFAYLARAAGPAMLGQYAAAVGFASLFAVISDAGIVYVLVRDLAAQPERLKSYFVNTLALKAILSAVLVGTTWIAARAFRYPADLMPLILIASLLIGVTSFSSLWTGIFRAWERMELEALFQGVESLLTLGLTVTILKAGGGIAAVLCGRIVAVLSICLVTFGVIQHRERMRWDFDFTLIRFLLAEGIPFALSAAIWQVYARMNIVWLAKSFDTSTVAFYQTALVVVEVPSLLLPLIFNRSVFPVFSRLRDQVEVTLLLRGGLKLLWLTLVPILIMLIGWAPVLIQTVYGGAYATSVPLLRILSVSLFFTYPCALFGNYLGATGRQKTNVAIAAVGLIVLPLLNMLLIPSHGVQGAAWAFVTTETLGVLLCLGAVRRALKETLVFSEWRRFWAVNVVTALVILAIPRTIFTLPAILFFYGAALLAGGVITRQERESVSSFLKRRLGLNQ